MATFQTLPGFRDFYPEDLAKRTHIFRLWRQTTSAFGFVEYDTPVLEPLDLYRAKSGDEIEAQLFSFTDKGKREVALRPEMTPSAQDRSSVRSSGSALRTFTAMNGCRRAGAAASPSSMQTSSGSRDPRPR